MIALTRAGHELSWQKWDDVFIVYQPSSAETHVFNETTALILRGLEQSAKSLDELREFTASELGIATEDLDADDLAFAMARIEELGLIERLDDVVAGQ
ncbi:HPr-rel-A system PqqD family peptide chaperone [Accumulibacter sp.]|uniref:HPr-rel-A system PqqD family peptide chaperone n=1 Tax=Accumulibacter sp. TaxID=2053492 RepID=UPI002629AE4D|nr:HPr-rel-A system PqqD family peptide chaperone [Accumulibacter sp.]